MIPLDTPLSEVKFTIVDVETTGLTRDDRVIELACIQILNSREINRFQSLVNPGMPINPIATEICGIRDEDVAQAPIFAEIAPEFDPLMTGAVFVAHNAPFDLSFLSRERKRWDLPHWQGPILDTLRLARNVVVQPRYSLSSLTEALALENRPNHRALADVEATISLMHKLISLIEPVPLTLGELLAKQELIPVPWTDSIGGDRPAGLIKVLQFSEEKDQVTEIEYESHTGIRPHWIRPVGVFHNGPLYYLKAEMAEREEVRTYRFDRIRSARISGNPKYTWSNDTDSNEAGI